MFPLIKDVSTVRILLLLTTLWESASISVGNFQFMTKEVLAVCARMGME